ncbi:MAG TPA: hypothetical protein VGN04_05190, partial [Herbaspirillum sp.]
NKLAALKQYFFLIRLQHLSTATTSYAEFNRRTALLRIRPLFALLRSHIFSFFTLQFSLHPFLNRFFKSMR